MKDLNDKNLTKTIKHFRLKIKTKGPYTPGRISRTIFADVWRLVTKKKGANVSVHTDAKNATCKSVIFF